MVHVRCGRNKCRVVSLEPLDHRRYISAHCGFVPEQFVIEPCLKDTALRCVEVLDVLLPALERMDEILDLPGCTCGDKLLGLGSQCVAGGYKVCHEVSLGRIVLIRYGHNVSGWSARPSGNTTTGRHVRKVGVARDNIGNVEKIVVRGLSRIGIEPVLMVEVCQLEIDLIDNR